MDIAGKILRIDGIPVHLTSREHSIIEFLSLRRDKVIPTAAITEYLYGKPSKAYEKAVGVIICKLRKKFSFACGGAEYLRTVRGQGYVLVDADRAFGATA